MITDDNEKKQMQKNAQYTLYSQDYVHNCTCIKAFQHTKCFSGLCCSSDVLSKLILYNTDNVHHAARFLARCKLV